MVMPYGVQFNLSNHHRDVGGLLLAKVDNQS
jgi:hypothetical protein